MCVCVPFACITTTTTITNVFFGADRFSACVTFLGVYCVYIFRCISHAMLDVSTLFVYVLVFSEAFLGTSVLHTNVDEECADVQHCMHGPVKYENIGHQGKSHRH